MMIPLTVCKRRQRRLTDETTMVKMSSHAFPWRMWVRELIMVGSSFKESVIDDCDKLNLVCPRY